MKIVFSIILSLLCFNAFAFEETYRVTGFDDDGEPMIGVIYNNEQPLGVNGPLMNLDGNRSEFYGRWNARGQMSGQTEDGKVVFLRAY